MTFGVVRRGAAALGLAGLVPTAVMLLRGDITPAEAGVRAAVTFVAVLVAARLISNGLLWLARQPGPPPSPSSRAIEGRVVDGTGESRSEGAASMAPERSA